MDEDDEEGGGREDEGNDRGAKRSRRNSNATTVETNDSRSASGAPRGGGGGGPAPTSRAALDPIVKLEAADQDVISRLKGHFDDHSAARDKDSKWQQHDAHRHQAPAVGW